MDTNFPPEGPESPPPYEPPQKPSKGLKYAKGCAGVAGGFVLVCFVLPIALITGGIVLYLYSDSKSAEEHQTAVVAELSPVIDKIAPPQEEDAPHDIDRTIRVIHEIDYALASSKSFKEYLQKVGRQDYSGVAPEILEARREYLDVILQLHAKQVELEDQEIAWKVTQEITAGVLSLVDPVDLGVAAMTGGTSIFFKKALGGVLDKGTGHETKDTFDKISEKYKERDEVIQAMHEIEQDLLSISIKNSEILYKYIKEWDKLCTHRDRAYLAAHNKDWDAVLSATQEAIALSPGEREAHILRAMALIEKGRTTEDTALHQEAREILRVYIDQHPGSNAPAFLLLGVLHAYTGSHKDAELALQQASTYYPKQAEELQSMVNPYKARSFLRKSKEGRFILETYKSTMLGAGYFSPDLQKAHILLLQAKEKEGRDKILDHFSRRRSQGNLDFIVSDFVFAESFLGTHWRLIFPQEPYLDLKASPSLMGGALSAEVINRSDTTLRNATLILCLRFTDMHREDYETIVIGNTLPFIQGRGTGDYGSLDIAFDWFGTTKKADDIVEHRAILISDDIVSWVDTTEYKFAEHRQFEDQKQDMPEEILPGLSSSEFLEKLRSDAVWSVDKASVGKDNIRFVLPAETAILKPIFSLEYGSVTHKPQSNTLDAKQIHLHFASVVNLDNQDEDFRKMTLHIEGLTRKYSLTWAPEEQNPKGYTLEEIREGHR